MRTLPTALLTGICSLALAGVAVAQSVPKHEMTVVLPNGVVEQIQYSGNVTPHVSFVPPTPQAAEFYRAPPTPFFGPDSPFAMMQRVSAEMNRQAAAMMHEVDALALQPMPAIPAPVQLFSIDAQRLPSGAQDYSFVATMGPGQACSESTEIIGAGPSQKPRVITHESGNCGGASGTSSGMPVLGQAPFTQSPQPSARLYSAKATLPAANPVQKLTQVAWLR
jgi:hypothetical protein